MTNTFLIVLRAALDTPDQCAFLRDGMGWAPLHLATQFEETEMERILSANFDHQHIICVPVSGPLDMGVVAKAMSFRDSVARCINAMLQDDATGQTMVFIRSGVQLRPEVICPSGIDLNNLLKYDVIMFDGGNSSGDSWLHTFHPKQMSSYFVDENPMVFPNQLQMEVSLDGGQTYAPAPSGVRVVYKDVAVPDKSLPGELHLNIGREGMISDLFVSGDGMYMGQTLCSNCTRLDDMVSELVNVD